MQIRNILHPLREGCARARDEGARRAGGSVVLVVLLVVSLLALLALPLLLLLLLVLLVLYSFLLL